MPYNKHYSETNLESVFSRETLLAMPTRKRLDGKMYPFMSLEVMIPVETLWTLIALEGTFVMRGGRLGSVQV